MKIVYEFLSSTAYDTTGNFMKFLKSYTYKYFKTESMERVEF